MLKVHFTAGTRAGRVVWLLEELGLEYEVNIMPFTKEGLKSEEHRARHSLGRVPVLEDVIYPFLSLVPLFNIFWTVIKMVV